MTVNDFRPNGSGPTRISRRKLILGTGAVTAGAVLSMTHPVMGLPARAATDDQFDAMRATWRDLLTGGDFDAADPDFAAALEHADKETESYLGLINRAADRPGVFVDMPFIEENTYDASSRVSGTLIRLEQIATSVRTTGSRFENNSDVIATVLAGLDTTNRKIYYPGRQELGNWYHWEISAPNSLMNACALLHENVPAEALDRYVAAVDYFIPDPHYQYIDDRRHESIGSNRMWLCQAVAVRGVVARNEERITIARNGLNDVFEFVTSGDGLYRDGSYLFHSGIPYTGSYGMSFVDRFSSQLVLFAGSPWELGGAEREFAFGTVDLAFAPVIYNNQFMDSVRGRSISRAGGDHGPGHQFLEILLRLAKAADADTAARWRAMGKGWLERDTFDDPLSGATIQRLALIKELRNDSAIQPAPEPVNHVLFATMDRSIHRRPDWAYTIAMCSGRVSRYEVSGDRENIKGWHTADGMTYLYNADNGQFADEFWPTVDPYRLPGTTVDTRRLGEMIGVRTRPDCRWVGGAVLNKTFAAVGMELNAIQSSLRAKKSWFCLDDSIVAVGSDITGGGGHYVEVTADAHVNAGTSADINYGSDNRMLVKKSNPNGTREAYLAFDLNDLPSAVESASLHFYAEIQDSGVGDSVAVDVHGVTGSWDERTITWNTKPATGNRLGSVSVDRRRAWRTVDVSSHVLEQIKANNSRVSVALRQNPPNDAGLSVWIASREYSNYGYDAFLYLTLAESNETVETVIENRNLHANGTNSLIVDGKTQPVAQGWSATFPRARWAHLDGVGGYVFPSGATVKALREERTGSWQDINGGGSPTPITRRYLTLWLDHGANPNAESYAYILLPGISAKRTAEIAADPGIEIGASTATSHTVRVPRLGITATNFWRPGSVRGLSVDGPCSIMIQERGDTLTVAVADTTQAQTSLNVELIRSGYTKFGGDDTITVQSTRPSIRFRVNVQGAKGTTQQVTFRR